MTWTQPNLRAHLFPLTLALNVYCPHLLHKVWCLYLCKKRVGLISKNIVCKHVREPKRLGCNAGHLEVSRCCTSGESDESSACRWWSLQARDRPWIWNPEQISLKVQNRGISGPTKRTFISIFWRFSNSNCYKSKLSVIRFSIKYGKDWFRVGRPVKCEVFRTRSFQDFARSKTHTRNIRFSFHQRKQRVCCCFESIGWKIVKSNNDMWYGPELLAQRNVKPMVYSDHYLQRLMETCLPVYLHLEPFSSRFLPHAVF